MGSQDEIMSPYALCTRQIIPTRQYAELMCMPCGPHDIPHGKVSERGASGPQRMKLDNRCQTGLWHTKLTQKYEKNRRMANVAKFSESTGVVRKSHVEHLPYAKDPHMQNRSNGEMRQVVSEIETCEMVHMVNT